MSRLHLGCGEDYRDGWVNVDAVEYDRLDVQHDLRDVPWPFEDGLFSEVRAWHVFEHLTHDDHADRVFPELCRVTRPGARIRMAVPLGLDAVADPTHRSRWTYRTPLFYSVNADPWQPGRTKDLPLRVVDRRVRVWGVGAFGVLKPVYWAVARWWPNAGQALPASAGELIVEFERQREPVDDA